MTAANKERSAPSRERSPANSVEFTPPAAIPTRFRGFVHRPELVSRLTDARGYPLVLVTAPPGYAKTSVLAEWAREDDRDFAWVTLEPRFDRPSKLLNRLVEALDSVGSRGGPFVLVIDDAHVLRTKGALNALETTIEGLPPEGQIALSSRKELALPVGRMRAHRGVFELTERDLAMNRRESAALLDAIGLNLGPREIDRLWTLTEGWPAALYLAGLSLGAEAEVTADPAGFGGDDRFVSDYLRDEFLDGVSVARLRFLMRSSVLEDLAGGICDEVLERSGSGRVLRELSRSKLPLEPLDHADGAYRFHPLFKQMLRAELRRA